MEHIVLNTPSRLHFGLIDMNGEIGRIDGGVGLANIRRARDAGANVFVAGSSVFKNPDSVEAVKQLRTAVENREEA